ncbi:MAG: anthranilate phosphoribosyltransferase [Magnetococcales bacterium]|nr:anthranilate phosphoribosyltransferase [Magnetococcales bacterium]
MTPQEVIAHLVAGKDLTREQARETMLAIMSGQMTDAQIGAYLVALRMKGERVEEIAGSAAAMRQMAVAVKAEGIVVDTCGTGGDGSGTFNISTTAAFVVAGCGVTVAKHGNRSISSRSGSADLLKALGVRLEVEVSLVERCLREAHIGFLFAPRHHGAMRHAMGPRKELGLRTVFNLLGPLTNPAGASRQVMGVFSSEWTGPLAKVLGMLGSRRAMVVHGSDGLDEITLTGSTKVAELLPDGQVLEYDLHPGELGLACVTSETLRGGDAEENAAITRAILSGEEGPTRDIVLLNAAAALYVADQAADLREGLLLAARSIDSGAAMASLEKLIALCAGSAAEGGG